MPRSRERFADAIAELIGPALDRVERIFDNELRSDLPSVDALVRHVGRFRGKMLRPTLLLLTGRAVEPNGEVDESLIELAAVVEMVHMSTLVHDDVLDEAELRRKGATINHLHGNEAAVLLGDYLISHSYHLCSGVEAPPELSANWAARIIGRTTNQLCEGELLQVSHRGNLELSEETYYEIIRRKTGALTAASCLLGARFAGADDELGRAMQRYGELIGMAFQVQDDVLDLLGDVREVGKSVGVDAEKQKLTLPLIHFLANAPEEHAELLRSLLVGDQLDRAEQVRQLVRPSDSVEFARDEARRLTCEAAACLEGLDDSPAHDLLTAVCDFVVARSA
ncbi:MAG: polyprenyl synthetase family protein [Planctomycetota bacterium]